MKNHKLDGIVCVVCNKRDAELLHHIDYTKNITIPTCDVCHKMIHRASRNPKHFSKSKLFSYFPTGRPTNKTISILPEHYLKIINLDKNGSFSGNMRKICCRYLDFHTVFQMELLGYFLTLKRKNY